MENFDILVSGEAQEIIGEYLDETKNKNIVWFEIPSHLWSGRTGIEFVAADGFSVVIISANFPSNYCFVKFSPGKKPLLFQIRKYKFSKNGDKVLSLIQSLYLEAKKSAQRELQQI